MGINQGARIDAQSSLICNLCHVDSVVQVLQKGYELTLGSIHVLIKQPFFLGGENDAFIYQKP
jgi:hypothetical protein